MIRVLGSEELPIAAEGDVVVVRRRARDLAQAHGFDAFATAAITTATSELSRNVWVHGGGGGVTIEEVQREGRTGLRFEFHDEGPGIEDVDLALQGGYSTRRSLGLGLSGSTRLVDDFVIDSEPGRGTRVRITKWARFGRG